MIEEDDYDVIEFLCTKNFYMEDGEIAFKKGDTYAFYRLEGSGLWQTAIDETGCTHNMSDKDLLIDAGMIPTELIKQQRNKVYGVRLYGYATPATSPVPTIKLYRIIHKCSLKEAKEWCVDRISIASETPLLCTTRSRSKAEEMAKEFDGGGALVRVEECSNA